MHHAWRESSDRTRSPRATRIASVLIAILALGVLSACGSSSGDKTVEDRRFATDPREPTPTVTIPTPTPTVEVTATLVAESSDSSPTPAAVSNVGTVYAIADNAVIAVDIASGESRVLVRGDHSRSVARVSPSADGSQVAVLYEIPQGGATRYDVEIHARTGETQASWSNVESALDRVAEPGKGRLALDWSNSANRIAVAFPNGGAVLLQSGNDPRELIKRSQAPAPLALHWSPQGDALAFVTRNANGDGYYLSLASVEALPIDPVRISGVGGDRLLKSVIWLQDGSAILAIQGDAARDNQVGGDLISIDRRTLKARLVTGSSLFGPAAQIVAVAPSPDGQSIAYVSVDPRSDGGWLATVWVMTRDQPVQQRVPLEEDPPVAGIAWTVSGLSVTLLEPDRVSVVTTAPSGEIVGEAEATPGASPVAQPEASPGASAPSPESSATPDPASPHP